MKTHTTPLVFAMVAGEPSGDQLAAGIILELKKIYPDARFVGVAGPKMIAAGCEALFAMEQLAVMGLVELLSYQLFRILKIRRQLVDYFKQTPPTLFIGVDAPDFNLPLEKKLKQCGIKTIHYVSPSIWAWRAGRINTIRQACDCMLTLFAFEKPLYDEAGVKAYYVGHPLADEIQSTRERQPLKLAPAIADAEHSILQKTIALLPGSRHGEIARMAPVFLETARLCYQANAAIRFVVPLVNEACYEQFQQLSKAFPELPITLLHGQAREVLQAADIALITSGTATLEAALLQCPMVMAYKTSPISAFLGRLLIRIRRFALPNILTQKDIVPEFMQSQATPARLAMELMAMLKRNPQAMLEAFTELQKELKQNSHYKTAQILREIVG